MESICWHGLFIANHDIDNHWKVVVRVVTLVRVRHSESKAMWEEAIARSGEVGSLRVRMRAGESRLRRRRSDLLSDSVIRVPLASASVHVV